jgi:hypothetical protein
MEHQPHRPHDHREPDAGARDGDDLEREPDEEDSEPEPIVPFDPNTDDDSALGDSDQHSTG